MEYRVNMTSPDSGENYTIVDDVEDMTIDRYLWVYALPVIFIIGVVGNILTVLVMRRRRMRGTATSIYLTVLAVADTAVLVTGLIPEWLYQTWKVDIAEIHQWVCKFDRFLFYGTGDVAVWILVAFTCDRFIAVCFPLKKMQFCTSKRAILACLIVLAMALVKNLHVFWTRGVLYGDDGEFIENCGKPQPYTNFEKKVRPWLVLAFVSLGPFIVIIVCNILIVKELVWSRRMRSTAGGTENCKAFTQTTAMCLSTSFTFLIFVTPSIVLLIGKPYWTSDEKRNLAYDISKVISNELMFLNHSINFFLYCLTGARFRSELVNMFTCGGTDDNGPSSNKLAQYTVSSSYQKCSSVPSTPQLTTGPRLTVNGNIAKNDNSDDKLCLKETVT